MGMPSPKFSLTKQDEKEEGEESKSKKSSKDTSENPDGPEGIAPKTPNPSIQEVKSEKREVVDADGKQGKSAETTSFFSTESEKPRLGQSEIEDDDEGFRTPTSLDHKIPVITECPPAPKKIRPSNSSSPIFKLKNPSVRRKLNFDNLPSIHDVVDPSMLPPTVQDDDDDVDRAGKKRRTDHASE